MRNAESDVQALLAEKGIAVDGTSERAVRREDALTCVQLFREGQVPIQGGDVYYRREWGVEPAYANWHVDRAIGESRDDFVARACDVAWRYIERFPDRPGDAPLFVLVASSNAG